MENDPAPHGTGLRHIFRRGLNSFDMKKYEFHEYAHIFPRLSEVELQQLADDITENGLKNPITLYQGKILDGRNRYLACELAGVEPFYTELTNADPLKYVISLNLNRRHLNESQRGVVAERLANMRVGRNWESNSLNLDDKNGCLNLDTLNQSLNLDLDRDINQDTLNQTANLPRINKLACLDIVLPRRRKGKRQPRRKSFWVIWKRFKETRGNRKPQARQLG